MYMIDVNLDRENYVTLDIQVCTYVLTVKDTLTMYMVVTYICMCIFLM